MNTHEAGMRKRGHGPEKKFIAGSVKGSRVGTEDQNMEDVDEKFLPNRIFTKPTE
jgi:hypothetical protein